MPNIGAVLKQEITRLARRETRSQTKSLSKASSQFRRDIAELKRQNSRARVEIARLQRFAGNAALPKASETGNAKLRFSVRSVKSQRKRLGVSAADFGKLAGVTGHTIYKWEHGGATPRIAQITALAALRSLGKREARQRLEQMGRKLR